MDWAKRVKAGHTLLPVRHDEGLYDLRSNRSCCSTKLPGTRCAVEIKVEM